MKRAGHPVTAISTKRKKSLLDLQRYIDQGSSVIFLTTCGPGRESTFPPYNKRNRHAMTLVSCKKSEIRYKDTWVGEERITSDVARVTASYNALGKQAVIISRKKAVTASDNKSLMGSIVPHAHANEAPKQSGKNSKSKNTKKKQSKNEVEISDEQLKIITEQIEGELWEKIDKKLKEHNKELEDKDRKKLEVKIRKEVRKQLMEEYELKPKSAPGKYTELDVNEILKEIVGAAIGAMYAPFSSGVSMLVGAAIAGSSSAFSHGLTWVWRNKKQMGEDAVELGKKTYDAVDRETRKIVEIEDPMGPSFPH